MDQMRLILAVLAALLALVFLAVWFAKGRQHSIRGRGPILFYVLLLFASSGLLLLKSQKGNVAQFQDSVDQLEQTEVSVPKQLNPDSIRSEENRQSEPQQAKQEQVATWTTTKVSAPRSSIQKRNAKSHPLQLTDNLDLPTRPVTPKERPVEDVVEAGILQAFEVIEIFFDTYATPAATSQVSVSGQSGSSIEFVTGSSELSLRSIQYLQTVAAELGGKFENGKIEIRAQTNETVISPEQRRQLTQSRAEAVRDVLTSQGFPFDRLVPIGSEQAGETRVKFVHRPN